MRKEIIIPYLIIGVITFLFQYYVVTAMFPGVPNIVHIIVGSIAQLYAYLRVYFSQEDYYE